MFVIQSPKALRHHAQVTASARTAAFSQGSVIDASMEPNGIPTILKVASIAALAPIRRTG